MNAIEKEREKNELRFHQYIQGRTDGAKIFSLTNHLAACLATDNNLASEKAALDDDWMSCEDEAINIAQPDVSDSDEAYEMLRNDIFLSTYVKYPILDPQLPIVFSSQHNPNTRQNRTERRLEGFEMQMDGMINAYMAWRHRVWGVGLDSSPFSALVDRSDETGTIILFDTYSKFFFLSFMLYKSQLLIETSAVTYSVLNSDEGIAAALLRHGMVPCAPFSPAYAISIRTLDLYRNLKCRCPQLTVQPFVKGLLDMQMVHTGTSFV